MSRMSIGVLFVRLAFLFILVLLRALLRREWTAVAFFLVIFALGVANRVPVYAITSLVWAGLAVFLLTRFGLLAGLANGVMYYLMHDFPLTTDGSAWYAGISLTGILLIAAITLYGFYTSLGGRPVFGGALIEE
jgi:hypothetical protein